MIVPTTYHIHGEPNLMEYVKLNVKTSSAVALPKLDMAYNQFYLEHCIVHIALLHVQVVELVPTWVC